MHPVLICNITASLITNNIAVIIDNTSTQEIQAYVCIQHPTAPELAPRTARNHRRNLARPERRLGDLPGWQHLPPGGYQIGVAPVAVAANWSPNVFTATEGSYFIPDSSTNDQVTGAPTGGGHNWAFDQGSTLCKQGDAGSAAGTTAWILPPNTSTDCIVLPIIKNGKVTNLGDIPFQGSVVTPVCDPTKLSTALAPNPANTYANQLGCSIAAFNNGGVPVATTAATATSYMFVAGIKGGLFHYRAGQQRPDRQDRRLVQLLLATSPRG